MNFLEEQKGELEALSEIYFNEITVISDKFPICFSIKIRSQASSMIANQNQSYNTESLDSNDEDDDDTDFKENDDDDNESRHGLDNVEEDFVKIQFTLPEKYPSQKPEIALLSSSGISNKELEQLVTLLDEKAEENIDCVMIFTLVNEVVEWLIKRSEKEEQECRQIEEQDEEERLKKERKRFEGTPVTKESFLEWKRKFDAELLEIKLAAKPAEAIETKRLTGRAMFELDKTLAESDLNFSEDIDPESLEGLLDDIEELDIDDDNDDEE